MYVLDKFINGNGFYRCEIAVDLIKYGLEKYNIEYELNDIISVCQNKCTKNNKKCKRPIKDKFVLTDANGDTIIVGNNCIGTLIEKKLVSNIDLNDFKEIKKIVKTKYICLICHKPALKGYHKKCIKGRNTKLSQDLNTQIKNKNFNVMMIPVYKECNMVFKLFEGNTFINNIKDRDIINKKTANAFYQFINEYKKYLDNGEKLLKLKNNCIIQSIKTQRRHPSPKQRVIIDKILSNYKRIKEMDKNPEQYPNYIRYGYTYTTSRTVWT